MSAFDYRNFDDRRKNSASAKQMLLEKFKARTPADDPDMIAKAEARAAVARAREEAELAAQIAREEAEALAAAERKAAELVEKKAARDARYAARKAKARR